ncbi:regulation of nuclear pre-mRNA domain-containing protein 2 isoform X1 [Pygocentrus nattereri]|uniref:Regulation of nuclear pre-mRNA domain-containing protein 2 n=1 Tax=Pygocentrus nattereri TaxID=42514 RepID=A0AAR2M3J9_PYGNA|nr:regulation of nuclear pre-mRNA domain-containing protein 2 isoform X1 [Pygocentrus nattereri]
MAAGAEAGHGRSSSSSTSSSSSSSSAALEATLDRRFQGVTNTMESIQGLSSWCIENKKHHSLVVRYWMKWLKKSEPSHRLNLFYLANDVIQNCKRKNAIAYRSAFADILPDAALLVRDAKVRKSVERIFSIWQERSIYPDELITELKATLQKKEQPPPPSVNPKTALKSKIVAEFAPHALIERLGTFKRSLEESELREKQLATLRVDVCSTEALKRLKDKAGGNKFSKDFEEGSMKLQEFVKFLEGQMQAGPPLLEALENAEVFYEMQYKEVKIVTNAYKTFANRVSNLKRKLDAIKATLPDLDDSPIPSPSEDAPSPTGSESPFHGLGARAGQSSVDREGARAGEQKDNRDVEDMDLSEEEDATNMGIIVEEKKEKTSTVAASKVTNSTAARSSHIMAASALAPPTKPTPEPAASQTPPSSAPTPTTPVPASPAPLQVNLANVDLGKISSILSSITNVMKNTGVSPVSRPSPGTPTTPSSHTPSSKTPLVAPGGTPASNPLASILSRVDISPEGILSALTKTQTNSPRLQGLSSLLSSARAGSLTSSSPAPSSFTLTSSTITTATVTTTPTTPTTPKTPKLSSSNVKRESERERGLEWEKVKEKEREKDRREREIEREEAAMPSLESKINSFLQGNPGFSALGLGLDDGVSNSPLLVGGDNADGTPVRDESGSTPTQDEIMDTPCVLSDQNPGCSGAVSPTAYRSDPWDAVIMPREDERKDRDYRTPSSSTSSRSQAFSPSGKNTGRSNMKPKEQDGMKRKAGVSTGPTSFTSSADVGVKVAKMEGSGGKSVVLRRTSGGTQNGGKEKEEKGKKGGKKEEDSEHYHRIETVVTTTASSSEGTPIEALCYSNRIQTVESIRVIGRGPRRASGAAARAGGAWYEEEEFMEAPLPHHPGDHTPEAPEELGLVPPPTHLLPQGQYPPPPYTSEDSTHPVHTHTIPQHHPPPSPFFPTPPVPPIPQPPPPSVAPPTAAPPLPQPPPAPSRDLPLSPTSAVMVGGVLVPIDRVLPHPPANLRPEGGGASSAAPARGKSLPMRPATLKEQFTPHHAPPLHRPGTPGVPPPLLGRGRKGPQSPSSPTTPTTPSPSGDPRPLLPSPNCLPNSAGSQRAHRPPSPLGLLRPPIHTPHTSPLSQRPLPRGGLPLSLPLPPPSLSREPLLPGVKRPGPAFRGGPLHPPKRPFLPPRY